MLLATLPGLIEAAPQASGCPVFPVDNVWNAPVDGLPRHPASDTYVATIGSSRGIHPDFGTFFERRSLDYDQQRAILSKRADAAPVAAPEGREFEGSELAAGEEVILDEVERPLDARRAIRITLLVRDEGKM